MSPSAIRTAMSENRQFAIFTGVVLVAVAFFPGSPVQIVDVGGSSSRPDGTASTEAPPDLPDPSAPVTTAPQSPPPEAGSGPPPSPPTTREPLRRDDLPTPEASPDREINCDIDTLFTIVDDLSEGPSNALGEVLDQVLPGDDPDRGQLHLESMRRLVRLATGCEAEQVPDDPDAATQYLTGLFVELLVDVLGTVPSTGLDPIPLPQGLLDVTDLVFGLLNDARDGLPAQVSDLLEPFAPEIREYCGTAELLLVLAPVLVADNAPVSEDDLTRLMAPISGICSVFDDDSFLDEP